MVLIEWTNDLKLGIEDIDMQHKKLVDMINEFYFQLKDKSSKELISKLINDMKQYALVHFETEERYLQQIGFPALEEHKVEHKSFIEKVADVEQRFSAGKLVLSFELTNFLKSWLVHHIKGSDMKYVKLFKESIGN